MELNVRRLSNDAVNLGFVRDTYEKVIRLTSILKILQNEPFSNYLYLKGGTAINLILFKMPRLSVDIDLDYDGEADKDAVMCHRKQIQEELLLYMKEDGYQFSTKSKSHYALDSFVFSYVNAVGQKDNIKIDINYSLRIHLLPLRAKRASSYFWKGEDTNPSSN